MMNPSLSQSALRAFLPLVLLLSAGCASPLMKAAARGDNEQVKALLDRGMDPNANRGAALFAAVQANKLETAKLLLSRGAKPDAQGTALCPPPKQGFLSSTFFGSKPPTPMQASALIVATHAGEIKLMQALLDAGADVNAKAKGGNCGNYTPLIFAAKDGFVEAVALLLNRNADQSVKTAGWGGKTALEWLQKEKGDPTIISMLQGPAGETPAQRKARLAKINAEAKSFLEGTPAPAADPPAQEAKPAGEEAKPEAKPEPKPKAKPKPVDESQL